MKTKVLYVLISDSSDYYAEQLFVSILSLRRNSPGAIVSILTDRATKDQLPGRGKAGPQLIEAPDEWIEVDLDFSLPKKLRSRMLKTGMRHYVNGTFLFIDCDTIIARPLDSIDNCPAELAFCLDHHCPFQEAVDVRSFIISDAKKLGTDLSDCPFYFNSGVILAKDTPAVRGFFERWQEEYLKGYEKGVTVDQPSLAKTINEYPLSVDELEAKWNCQLLYGARHLGETIIFHYFGGLIYLPSPGFGRPLYILNNPSTLSQIRSGDSLPPEVNALLDDFFQGISPFSHLSSESDALFWTTRRYRYIRRHVVPGTFSLLEFLLKVRARLPFAK